MPTLGKSVLPCEGAVINIGIAQCSLAELMADPLIGLVMKSDRVDRRDRELFGGGGSCGSGRRPSRDQRSLTGSPIVKQSRIVYSLQAILSNVGAECTLLGGTKAEEPPEGVIWQAAPRPVGEIDGGAQMR
jgi:hypothetical protein